MNTYSRHPVVTTTGEVLPVLPHDCPECLFVGTLRRYEEHAYDVYVCFATHDANRTDSESLVLRHGDEPDEIEAHPLWMARHLRGFGGDDGRWPAAVRVYDAWAEAGKLEADLLHQGEAFFVHFTVAVHGSLSEEEDGTAGVTFTVVGLSAKVTREHVDHYVSVRHPETHCRHSYDCCANSYSGPARWEFVPGTADRAVVVTQGWHLNI